MGPAKKLSNYDDGLSPEKGLTEGYIKMTIALFRNDVIWHHSDLNMFVQPLL